MNIIMRLKSITIPRPCKIATYLSAFTVIILIRNVASQTDRKYRQREVLDDVLEEEELNKYLTSLEKVIQFVDRHRLYTDINLSFGLFLTSVNLNTIFQLKGDKLPAKMKPRLQKVLLMNDDIIKYFGQMFERYTEENDSDTPQRYIVELFYNGCKIWTNHLQKFNTNLIKITYFYSKVNLEKRYSNWPTYKTKVYDFDAYTPGPEVCDQCIAALSHIPINNEMQWTKCNVDPACTKAIFNGTDFGYGITHRILYFIMARFARGCTVISGSKDKSYIDELCSKVYNEATYISNNKFEIPDLMMEQISLCTLEGHAQFLRRSWINGLLEFQTEFGCFGETVPGLDAEPPPNYYEKERSRWFLSHSNVDILGGLCNSHTTGTAAAMVSAAIRYLIETHY